jgi:ABC-type methionine transport system ATPase subunit
MQKRHILISPPGCYNARLGGFRFWAGVAALGGLQEVAMATRKLRLIYPPSLLREPIVSQLIRRFDLQVNILLARIELEEGWLVVEMNGPESVLEQAESWLRDQGIDLQPPD